MLTQHFERIAKHSIYYLGRKLFCKIKDLPINISENDRPLYPTTNCRIHAQIPECCAEKRNRVETPKVAQSATPEYSDDSDDSDDSNDNIASDSSESCVCDEEGPCDHHMIMRAIAKYEYQQYVARVSGKK
jgi:hypothetical protein